MNKTNMTSFDSLEVKSRKLYGDLQRKPNEIAGITYSESFKETKSSGIIEAAKIATEDTKRNSMGVNNYQNTT